MRPDWMLKTPHVKAHENVFPSCQPAPRSVLMVDQQAPVDWRDWGSQEAKFSLRVKTPVISHPARGQVQGWKGRRGGVGVQRRRSIEDISFHGKEGCLWSLQLQWWERTQKEVAPWGRLQARGQEVGVGDSKDLIRLQVFPALRKFTLHHFAFMKDLCQYLFSLMERNPKRIFTFPGGKRQKGENSIVIVSQ